jgi:fructokinase
VRVGIDLGGTKIEAIAIDRDGRERFRRRVQAPRGSYDDTLRAISAIVCEAERATSERARVGIGIPGSASPATGRIRNANSTWLNGRPLPADLERVLARPVRLENDANCFALSEATDGAGAGATVVFGVIVGTGTGGGIVASGRVLVGRNAIGGEWGHNPLPWPTPDEWPGPPCYCGRTGCIETFLSGPAVSREFAARGGGTKTALEIAAAAEAGDARAMEAIDLYVDRMGRALASVINLLDPDVVVLGGGLSNIAPLYDRVPAIWPRWTFSDVVTTPLKRAVHGDASGVRGAAWLWRPDED